MRSPARLVLLCLVLGAGCSYTAPTPAPTKAADPVVAVAPPTVPAVPFKVAISGVPTSITMGLPATFEASSTAQPASVTYRWTWGDGGTPGSASSSSTSSHVFGSVGPVTVTVTAASPLGEASASIVATVLASPPVPAPPTPTPTPTPAPLAVTIGCTPQPPLTLVPCNLATTWYGASMSPGSLRSEAWEWGDGKRDAGTPGSPLGLHTYSQAGTYLIVVNITAMPTPDSGIQMAQTSKSIVIAAATTATK